MRRDKAKHCFAPTQGKVGDGVLRKAQLVKYAFTKDNQHFFSITRMCRVLSVKPSSYYDWLSRDISDQQIHRNHCELLVKAAHSKTYERYGVDRLHAKLIEQGFDISLYMVRSIFDEHGIKCRRHKCFKVNTDSNHNKLVIQTYWIKSLMLSVLMSLGPVTSPISG